MMRKCILLGFLIIGFVLGCDSDDSGGTRGSLDDIAECIGDALLTDLQSFGFPLNTGDNPPDITGSWLISPFTLEFSNDPIDEGSEGGTFAPLFIQFSNLDTENLTLDYSHNNISETGEQSGALLTGTGDDFTVTTKLTINYTIDGNSEAFETYFLISGTLSDEGIINLKTATHMIDDMGFAPQIISTGSTRISFDGDGISQFIDGRQIPFPSDSLTRPGSLGRLSIQN